MKTHKKKIKLVILLMVILTQVGCVGVGQRTREGIEAYNDEVFEVVRYVTETKIALQLREQEILDELQKETAIIDGIYIEGEANISGAKQIDILRNEYFTSLNAESIRQVMVITKGSEGMYVELIWKDNKLEKGIRRKIQL